MGSRVEGQGERSVGEIVFRVAAPNEVKQILSSLTVQISAIAKVMVT